MKLETPPTADFYSDHRSQPRQLGCTRCPYEDTCGALSLRAQIYDCDALCCKTPASCPYICVNKPLEFVAKVAQIDGFDLANVKRFKGPQYAALGPYAPVLFHGYTRTEAIKVDAVAVPLFDVLNTKKGVLRFSTKAELADQYKFSAKAKLILTGVDKDEVIERWWDLKNRSEVLRQLARFGADLVMVPNYSLPIDVPRTEDLFNMKRIARVWAEIGGHGIQASLHLNARTDQDFRRWTRFVSEHEEVKYVSLEMGTGGRTGRAEYYVEQLCLMAVAVARPLHLVIRGGYGRSRETSALAALHHAFASITFVDSAAFMKAMKRKRAIGDKWQHHATSCAADLDELLAWNVEVRQKAVRETLMQPVMRR